MSKNISSEKKLFSFSEMATFSGVVRQKLPNIQFLVEITHFPDGSKVPEGEPMQVTASLTGKMRSKSIKIAIADNVSVGISMESAPFKKGTISYRDKKPKKIEIISEQTRNEDPNKARGSEGQISEQ